MATKHWRSLGWEIDLFIPPGPEGFMQSDEAIIEESGMHRIVQIIPGTTYDFALINGMLHISYIGAISGINTILWVHEAAEVLWGSSEPIDRWMSYFFKANQIIFSTLYQSEIVFKSFIQNLPLDRVSHCSYAVPTIDLSKNIIKDQSPFRIVSIGSIIHRKRADTLTQAVVNLQSKLPLIVDFVGDLENSWTLGENFNHFITNSPEFIRWHGCIDQEEKESILSSADVFCLPSESESFGLAPLESAKIGIPVILANLEVYQYVGWKHLENCLLFPVGDISALQDCILLLKDNIDLRTRLIASAKKLAAQYNEEAFLSKITSIVSKFTIHP